jgi:hypothetical protein
MLGPLHFNWFLFQISEEVLDAEAEELEEETIDEGKDDEEEPSPPEPDGELCVWVLQVGVAGCFRRFFAFHKFTFQTELHLTHIGRLAYDWILTLLFIGCCI